MAAAPMSQNARHPPTIDLQTVRLRPLGTADAAALYAYLREPVVTELTSYPEVTPQLVDTMIQRSAARWAAGEPSRWAVALRHTDHIVGTCGFNDVSLPHRWAEIAFDLAPAHWGRGLMRQAVAAALHWAFQQDQLDRVHAYVRVDNLRSQRLLEQSGFLREGRLRRFRLCRGHPYDFFIYALLRSDATASRQSS